MRFNSIVGLLGTLAVACAVLPPAHAAIITKTFSGVITSVAAGSDIGLEVGDILSGSATFDTSLLTGVGTENQTPDINSALKLHVDLGPFSFDEDDDNDFPGAFPRLTFQDGVLVDINFQIDLDGLRFFFGFGEIEIERDRETLVTGILDFDAVPEPTALALFGLGLAGVGLVRRRAAARRHEAAARADSER